MSNPTQQPTPQARKIHEVDECVTVRGFFSEGDEDKQEWDSKDPRVETVTIIEHMDKYPPEDDPYYDGEIYWVRLPTAPENEDCRECYMFEITEEQEAA